MLFRAVVCLQHMQDHNQYEKSCIHRISFIQSRLNVCQEFSVIILISYS
ncbi:hypothetical protein Gotri_022115 [Gossypium trilobum]|uniref:Uncharacterized protein n=1 Tax=Gossypium trilobum TaxID=34281 RepID=A0A7J9DFG9_9ROSI|nr:hypothetical protein [Gossypium trilobum]